VVPISRENVIKALEQARQGEKRKFTQSFDLSITFKGLDLKKAESRINEEVMLPHGIGRTQKVVFFAGGELARKARDAGADLVLDREDIEALQKDRKRAKEVSDSYDSFVSQSDFMPLIGKALGPILSPRGKMPRPVPQTVDPKPIIERYKKTVRARMRDQPVIHVMIGVESMKNEQLADNIQAVLDALEHKFEAIFRQIASIQVKVTMGKPSKIEV
jgi:large subunit ribosomal protein L1